MGIIESLTYGFVQGVAEYLPISSSSHLILLPKFLGTEDPGLAFDVFLHIGTLGATLMYFWKDWWVLVLDFVKRKQTHDIGVLHIVMGTLPAIVLGGLFHNLIETVLRGNVVIAVAQCVGGILLFSSDRFIKAQNSLSTLSLKQAFAVGCFQCLSLVPGMSRSGSTLIGGRVVGLGREASAKFSFLLSAPITAAAVIYEMRHFSKLFEGDVGVTGIVVGGLSSFLFGALAIGGLMKYLRTNGFAVFMIYRILLAGVILWYLGA